LRTGEMWSGGISTPSTVSAGYVHFCTYDIVAYRWCNCLYCTCKSDVQCRYTNELRCILKR